MAAPVCLAETVAGEAFTGAGLDSLGAETPLTGGLRLVGLDTAGFQVDFFAAEAPLAGSWRSIGWDILDSEGFHADFLLEPRSSFFFASALFFCHSLSFSSRE